MRDNKLREYLTTEEYEKLLNDRDALLDDLNFFTALMRRSKTSRFVFEVSATTPLGGKLMKKLYDEYYRYSQDEFHIMLTELEVAKKFAFSLTSDTDYVLTADAIKEIHKYFKEQHYIDLAEWIDYFVGCSHSCRQARKTLSMILTE